ncbi:MAG: RNA polymerase sigma factor [Myxococcales bacterium]|nr:RNA polymerase sigma factor [Myxococcales bacterium]
MQSDFELLEAWQDGDEAAGNLLFDRHFDDLYAFFRGKLSGVADDLVQKTFLACIEGRDRFRGEASFRTYMFAAARRILWRQLDHLRRDEALDPASTSLHDLDPTPSQVLAERNEQRLVRQALRRIPVVFQVAIELYYVQGFRGPEIAQILEISEATVRSRIRRGLEQLRAAVEQLSEDPALVRSTLDELELEGWTSSAEPEG